MDRDVDLDRFVEARYASLLRTAYLLTGNQHAAEDLLQDALTKSWSHAQRHTLEQPGAFVRRCMVNQYLSQGRRAALIREEPTPHADLEDSATADEVTAVAARDAMWTELAALPRHQRVILVLRFYEDMSESQIADLLDIGVGAVRSGSWRGLERLRKSSSLNPEDQHA